jgi:hypothetical protein
MADVNINTTNKRTDADVDGVVIKFTASDVGADTYFILNTVDGSIRERVGKRAVVPPGNDSDRGVYPTKPRQGAQQTSAVELDIQYHSSATATELESVLTRDDTSDGYVPVFETFILEFPTYRGADTGVRKTYANMYVVGDVEFEHQNGGGVLKMRLECTKKPTVAAYDNS